MSEHVIAVAVWTAWKLSTTIEIVLSSLNCLGFNRKQNCTTPSPEYGDKETNGIFIQKASKKEKHKRFIGVIVWLVGTMDMQNKNIFLISYNYLFFFSIRIQTWVFPSSYTLVVVYFESVRNLELQPTRRNGRAHVGPRQWSSLQIAIGEWNTVVPSHDSPCWILVFLVIIVRRITRSIKSVTFLNNCYMITQLRVWKSEIMT